MSEGVDGNHNHSESDKKVSEEISSGTFARLCLPWESIWVIQCGVFVRKLGIK